MSSKRRRPREEPEVPGSFHLSMKDLAEAGGGEDPLPEKKYKKLFDITWIDTEEEAKAAAEKERHKVSPREFIALLATHTKAKPDRKG